MQLKLHGFFTREGCCAVLAFLKMGTVEQYGKMSDRLYFNFSKQVLKYDLVNMDKTKKQDSDKIIEFCESKIYAYVVDLFKIFIRFCAANKKLLLYALTRSGGEEAFSSSFSFKKSLYLSTNKFGCTVK